MPDLLLPSARPRATGYFLSAVVASLAAIGIVGCYTDLASVGEKGDTSFSYRCVGAHDPACASLVAPDAFPSPIARGSVFRVTVGLDDVTASNVGRSRIVSGSEDYLASEADDGDNTFVAVAPGEVGVAAFVIGEARILDVFHLRIVEPASLAVTCEGATPRDAKVKVPLGARTACWIVARNTSGVALAGAMRGAWTTSTPAALALRTAEGIAVDGAFTRDEITLEGLAEGPARLDVKVGERSVSLDVEVTAP